MTRSGMAAFAAALLTLGGCGGGDDGGSPSVDAQADRSIEVGGSPVAVAVGEGAVWVADNVGNSVSRIDPESMRARTAANDVGRGPLAIAAGEGAIWVASGDGSVARVDPGSGRVTEAHADVSLPGGIAVGDGSVWVTDSASGTLVQIDPDSLRTVGHPIDLGKSPFDVAVGDGMVWVANLYGGTVDRVNARTGKVDEVDVSDELTLGLTLGEGGAWVATSADQVSTIRAAQIDPDSLEVEEGGRLDGAVPVRLAAGEGAVWATLVGGFEPPKAEGASGVVPIDPATREPSADVVKVGVAPQGIAVGADHVWVANSGDGTVTPITARP